MKHSTRKNRTVLRKKTKGMYTIVHNAFLNDKRLSPTAKTLFIMILSDADDFVYSRQRYITMLNVNEKTYQRAFDELVQTGYAKVTKFKETKLNNYIFSEFGNLKQEEVINSSTTEQPKTETPTSEVKVETSKQVIPTNEEIIQTHKNICLENIDKLINQPIFINIDENKREEIGTEIKAYVEKYATYNPRTQELTPDYYFLQNMVRRKMGEEKDNLLKKIA
jgi:DNA-binding transcriptional regulator YhcF (GntR family)